MSHAQNMEKQRLLKLSGFGFESSFGGFFPNQPVLTMDEYRNYINNPDAFFPNDTFTYEEWTYNGSLLDIKVFATFSPLNRKYNFYRNRHEFRLFLGYHSNQRFCYVEDHASDHFRDTFVNEPQLRIIRDSFYSRASNYEDYYHELSIGASYMLKTNPCKFLSLTEAFAIELGRTFRSYLNADYGESYHSDTFIRDLTNPVHPFQSIYSSQYNSETKNTWLQNRFILRAYVPVGLQFHLPFRKSICSHIELTAQGLVGFELLFAPVMYKEITWFRNFSFGLIYRI